MVHDYPCIEFDHVLIFGIKNEAPIKVYENRLKEQDAHEWHLGRWIPSEDKVVFNVDAKYPDEHYKIVVPLKFP